MRKILALLGAVGLTVTTGASVTACGNKDALKQENEALHSQNRLLTAERDKLSQKINVLNQQIQSFRQLVERISNANSESLKLKLTKDFFNNDLRAFTKVEFEYDSTPTNSETKVDGVAHLVNYVPNAQTETFTFESVAYDVKTVTEIPKIEEMMGWPLYNDENATEGSVNALQQKFILATSKSLITAIENSLKSNFAKMKSQEIKLAAYENLLTSTKTSLGIEEANWNELTLDAKIGLINTTLTQKIGKITELEVEIANAEQAVQDAKESAQTIEDMLNELIGPSKQAITVEIAENPTGIVNQDFNFTITNFKKLVGVEIVATIGQTKLESATTIDRSTGKVTVKVNQTGSLKLVINAKNALEAKTVTITVNPAPKK